MPQVNERRTANGETREWNGSRWEPVGEASTAPQEGSALSRFFGGAAKTSPLNPMNLIRAASDIPGTMKGMIAGPVENTASALGDIKDVWTNERGGGPVMGRVTSALEALKHMGGAVPLIGQAGIEAGGKIGEGDFAGGAGELAGLASGALLPKIAGKAPGVITKGGQLAERLGNAAEHAGGVHVGGVRVPLSTLGLVEAGMRHDPMGLAVAAAPYALKYGGRGAQKLGGALESLKGLGRTAEEARPPLESTPEGWNAGGPAKRARAQAAQAAAREGATDMTPGDIGDVPFNGRPTGPTGYSPTGAAGGPANYMNDIVAGIGNKGAEMGAQSIEGLRRQGYNVPEAGFRTRADIDRFVNTEPESWYSENLPDFTYEGGGELPPAAPGFNIGGPTAPPVRPTPRTPKGKR